MWCGEKGWTKGLEVAMGDMKKLITILLLVINFNAFSQDDPTDGDGTVPVDGGLSLLLAAGAAYAGRRLYRKGTK